MPIRDKDAKLLDLLRANAREPAASLARKLGIGTARSIGECLDILAKATEAQEQPGLLQRLATLVGWR